MEKGKKERGRTKEENLGGGQYRRNKNVEKRNGAMDGRVANEEKREDSDNGEENPTR